MSPNIDPSKMQKLSCCSGWSRLHRKNRGANSDFLFDIFMLKTLHAVPSGLKSLVRPM